MRKFTKEHNEIGWLFPSVLPEDNPEEDFDTFEERGKILFEQAYQGKETFTKEYDGRFYERLFSSAAASV